MFCLDIHSNHRYPSSALSNFASRSFVIDDVQCNSMEGFLQSLKFKRVTTQRMVCRLEGILAKARGSQVDWQADGGSTLWWNGKAYDRHGQEYQELLDRAYEAMYTQCPDFRDALRVSGRATLFHSIGKNDPAQTILTASELCSRLTKLRDRASQSAPQPVRQSAPSQVAIGGDLSRDGVELREAESFKEIAHRFYVEVSRLLSESREALQDRDVERLSAIAESYEAMTREPGCAVHLEDVEFVYYDEDTAYLQYFPIPVLDDADLPKKILQEATAKYGHLFLCVEAIMDDDEDNYSQLAIRPHPGTNLWGVISAIPGAICHDES